MPNTITTSTFTTELIDLLTETFEQVQGMYLDKGTSLFETLATLSAAEASIPVGGQCATMAAQVDHTRYYLDVLEVYMRGEKPESVNWDEVWQSVGTVDEAQWNAIQERLHGSYQHVRAKIVERTDWDNAEAVSAAMSIVVHTAYHLGEIRQALCVIKG